MREFAESIYNTFEFIKYVNPYAGFFLVAWLCMMVWYIFRKIDDDDVRKAFLNVKLSLLLCGIFLLFSSIWTELLYPAVVILMVVIFFIIWQHRRLLHGLSPSTITFYVLSYILLLIIMFWTLFVLIGKNT